MSTAIMGDSVLDAVVASATVDDVLRIAGYEPPVNERKNIRCPLPDHADSKPSFSVQKSGQGWKCFGCGNSGGVLPLVIALGLAIDKASAVDFLAQYYRISTNTASGSRPRRAMKPFPQFEIKPPVPSPKFTTEESAELHAALRGGRPVLASPGEAYHVGRGITHDFSATCRVGYHPSWLGCGEAILFLGFDQGGNLVCAQGRYLSPTATPKARSRGKVSLGVFSTPGAFARGINGRFGPVAIVEAPLDAILLAQSGLPSVATFGSTNRPAWLRKALAGRDVILALDDDAAGKDAARWYRNNLNLGTDTSVTLLFDGEKDPGELWKHSRSTERLAELVEEAIQAAYPLRLAVATTLEVLTAFGERADQVPEVLPSMTEETRGVVISLPSEIQVAKLGGWDKAWPVSRPSVFPPQGAVYYERDGLVWRVEYDDMASPAVAEQMRRAAQVIMAVPEAESSWESGPIGLPAVAVEATFLSATQLFEEPDEVSCGTGFVD